MLLRACHAAGAAALALSLATAPAAGHPHVWADIWMNVVFDDAGRLAGVSQSWRLDQTFTQVEVIPYADADRNGVLNGAEIDDAKANYFVFVRFNRYFTRIVVDDAVVAFTRSGELDIAYADGLFTVSFELRLDTPVDVRNSASVDVYDGEIYYYLDLPRIVAPGEAITIDSPVVAGVIEATGTPPGCTVGRRAPESLDPMAVLLLQRLGLADIGDPATGFPVRVVVRCGFSGVVPAP